MKSILEGNENLILNKDNIFENASLFLMPYARSLKDSDNFYKLRKIPSVLKDAGYDGYYELFHQKVM